MTITPSSSPSTRPNVIPFIGQPGQKIILTNTFVNPTTIEIDMVEHDASTLAHALYGNQTKAITPGIYTIYDENNQIYKQYNLYEIKDEFSETLYEVREERTDIDETLGLDNITNV
jgi:Mg2+ and Co2+ transporter CorA